MEFYFKYYILNEFPCRGIVFKSDFYLSLAICAKIKYYEIQSSLLNDKNNYL